MTAPAMVAGEAPILIRQPVRTARGVSVARASVSCIGVLIARTELGADDMMRVFEDAIPACSPERTGAPTGWTSRLPGCVKGPVCWPPVGGPVCHLCSGSLCASL